jgi:hypothetical protein
MMRLGGTASLLVAFYLLASSATAFAAWVLRTETEAMSKVPEGRYKSVSFDRNVYDTREACEVALVQLIEGRARTARDIGIKVFRPGEDSTDYKDTLLRIDTAARRVTEVLREQGPGPRSLVAEEYTCLPDTVDPRGPKGK